MRKQIKEAERVADHPPQNTTKKASRPNAPDSTEIATENRKEVKRPGQVSKDAVPRRSTRREMADVPETEGERFVFHTSNRTSYLLFQRRIQPPAPLDQGRTLCAETMVKKLFLEQNLQVGLK